VPNVRAFQLDWDAMQSAVEGLRFSDNRIAKVSQKTGTAAGMVVVQP
jgi:hypothetical protein